MKAKGKELVKEMGDAVKGIKGLLDTLPKDI